MGAALSFLGQKLFASSTLINAKCENISCCTSVAAVHPPVVHGKGGFLKKRMTIYVDSRKRVAGSDSDFEVDLGESLHLQSDARLAVYKIRLADSFLSTDRGRYLYWVGRVHGPSAGGLDQLQLCHRHLQRDHQQPERCLRRQQAHPERPGAAPAISRRGGLPRRAARLSRQALQRGPHAGPELRLRRAADFRIRPDDGAQRGLPALRPAGQRQQSAGQPGRRHFVQDHAEERSGYHCGDGLGRRALHGCASA